MVSDRHVPRIPFIAKIILLLQILYDKFANACNIEGQSSEPHTSGARRQTSPLRGFYKGWRARSVHSRVLGESKRIGHTQTV